jgi:hypothetical protein
VPDGDEADCVFANSVTTQAFASETSGVGRREWAAIAIAIAMWLGVTIVIAAPGIFGITHGPYESD